MLEAQHRTKKGDRVALKHDRADVYPASFGGSEAVVLDQKIEMGFPMVYVEWDKRHWAYNGESNMWTFEDHFDLVEDRTMTEPDKSEIAGALEVLKSALLGDETKKPAEIETEAKDEPTMVHTETDDPQKYIENVGKAHEIASHADAFLLVAVKASGDSGDLEATALTPFIVSSYQKPVAGLFLEIQLSHMAALAHEQSNVQAMKALVQKKPE